MGLTLYKSSAGSGKTFTLVRLYLEKVIKYPSLFRNILAVTFTNKATEEMKTRIIHELDNLASKKDSKYLSYLTDKTNLTAEEICIKAKEVLTAILHEYSSFSISTIDSYFQVLSRTLSRELHLPFKYNIELNLDSLCDTLSDELLAEAGQNTSITKWLQELLLDRLDQNKTWNIQSDLKKMTLQLLTQRDAQDQAIMNKQEDIIQLIHELKKIRNEVEKTMRQLGEEGIKLILISGYAISSFSHGKSGAAAYLFKIAEKNSNANSFEIKARVKKALEDPDSLITAPNKKDKQLVTFVNESLHPLLCQAADYYESNSRNYISAIEVLKLIYHAGISRALHEKIKKYRDEFQVFLLSDTTRILREMISENDAPFIYEKTGNTYRHIFIDEFQDTSTEQWGILLPLVINSLSGGNDVLLVGDAKQSIYRWRGGNMHLIIDGVKKDLTHFSEIIKDEKLNTNYRSLGEIVNFNNLFFAQAISQLHTIYKADAEILNTIYGKDEITQFVKPELAKGGYISFHFFENPRKIAKQKTEDENNDEELPRWKENALLQLNDTISDLLKRGYHLKDIAILFRNNSHEQEIADHLYEENKYDFISGNTLLLSRNSKINFVLNCFRLLLDTKSALLHYDVNCYLNMNTVLSNKELIFSRNSALNDKSNWSNSVLLFHRKHLLALPVDFAYYEILKLSAQNDPDPFLDKFTDLILDFIGSTGTGVSEFLKWWDEHVENRGWSVEIPAEMDAIRILSIHKAKGLQFPVVILPFLDWPIIPNRNSVIWVHSDQSPFNLIQKIPLSTSSNLKNSYFSDQYTAEYQETLLDNLNVLYVAFTRAENELHVFGNKKSNQGTIGDLLLNTLKQSEIWSNNFHDGEQLLLKIGEPVIFSKGENLIKPNDFYNPQSVKAERPRFLNQSTNAIPELQVKFESEEIIFGNYVHSILSFMNSKKDLDHNLHAWEIKEVLNKDGIYLNNVKETVEKVWDLMENRGWTGSSSKHSCEPEICDETGAVHRPDRVIMIGNKAIIIDFKTGTADKEYHNQVKGYCQLLLEIGFSEVEGYLIYTSTLDIEQVHL